MPELWIWGAMSRFKHILFAFIFVLFLFAESPADFSFSGGSFEFTYDGCNDWTQYTDSLSGGECSDLGKNENITCASGNNWELINSTANNSGGGGGKGQRHWYGDIKNETSGGTFMGWTPQSELWIRWYQRWDPTTSFGINYHSKHLYFHNAGVEQMNFGISTQNGWRFWIVRSDTGSTSIVENTSAPVGTRPSDLIDGNYHAFEIRLKGDTNNNNGIIQLWINGINVIDEQNLDNRIGSGLWYGTKVGANHEGYSNDPCKYMDFDDFHVVTPTYFINGNGEKDAQNRDMIGPIGWSSADTDAPTIGTTSPSGAQVCIDAGGNDTRIEATVTDATAPINCEFSTNSGFTYGTGTDMSPTDGGSGADFYYDFTNQACNASYTYYMKCQDSAGTPNTSGNATFSYSIDAFATDTTDPTVAVTSPTAAATYDNGSVSPITLSGTSSDNVAVSTVTWSCPSCTPSSGTASGTTTWSMPPISLAGGQNVITVTATDTSNNTAVDVLTATYTPPSSTGAIGYDGGNMQIGYAASGMTLQYIYSQ